MKTILLSILMLIGSATYAHHVQQYCQSGGRVKMVGTDFRDGGKTYVKVTLQNGLWENGSSDTLVKLDKDYAFCIYVPNGAGLVTFQNTNHNGASHGEIYCVQTISCTSLPLVFGKVTARKLSAGEGEVTFTVHSVENVSYVNVLVSLDGKTYKVRAVVFPTEGTESKTYSVKFKL